MRSHPLRNVLSVVVTEHDPATGTTSTTSWRIDLRAAPRDMAGDLRRAVLVAIPTLAATAQDLPAVRARLNAALDAEVDGYPSGSAHLGSSSDVSDTVYAAATARIADDRAEGVRTVHRNLDAAVTAACALRGALERLERA